MSEQIRKALRHKYNKPGYLLFEEVKRSSGYMKPERFADALSITIFPSIGISLTGFEIKTARADLLTELRDLPKSEAIKQFCDYWILIVPEGVDILKGRVQVPDEWGIWKHWHNDSYFNVYRKPKQLYPKPVDRYFLASLLSQPNTAEEFRSEPENKFYLVLAIFAD